jgi:hypothetical protein
MLKMWGVTVTANATVEDTFFVEAETQSEAEEQVLARAGRDGVWTYLPDSADEFEVSEVWDDGIVADPEYNDEEEGEPA